VTDIDTLARRHAAAARATTEGISPPPFTPPSLPARHPGLINLITVVATLVALVGVTMLIGYFVDEQPVVTPDITVVTVPDSTLPESSSWPLVTGREFIPLPISSPVGGQPIPPIPDAFGYCWRCSLTLLEDNRVLMVTSSRAFLFDPDSEGWSPTGEIVYPSEPPSGAVRLADGRVLLTGSPHPVMTNETGVAQVYEPTTGTFRDLGPVPHGAIPVLLPDGRVLIYGGTGFVDTEGIPSPVPERIGVFDPTDDSITGPEGWAQGWTPEGMRAVPLLDGRVLILSDGGYPRLYDPATATLESLRRNTTAVRRPAVTLLDDGRVLVSGGVSGIDQTTLQDKPSAEAEIFDPQTGVFTAVGPMVQARDGHTALTLPDGRVLIVGGAGATAEIFDPEQSRFLAAPAMARPRFNAAAVVLDDGRVLIVGGGDGTAVYAEQGGGTIRGDQSMPSTAEIYQPDATGGLDGCCVTGMIGFTMGFEVALTAEQRTLANSGEAAWKVRVEVPPRGLDGLHSTRFNQWTAGARGSGGPQYWSFTSGLAPDWCDDGADCVEVEEDHCTEGCEFLFDVELDEMATIHLGASYSVTYLDGIPAEAAGLTMTIVEGG